MTPLLGTKTPSAPVGDAPLRDDRAVRAAAGKVFHESRDTKHESRPFVTRHGLGGRCVRRGCARDAKQKTAAWSLLSGALWRGMGRLWRGMGGILPPEPLSAHRPRRQHGLLGFHETSNMDFPCPPATPRRATPSPANGFFTKHETRDTNHGLCGRCVRRGCARDAQSETPARSLLSCALWRGMGRLWRGMGGILPPEPLSAHRPRRQHGLLGFHETSNMDFPCPPAAPRRATPSPANGFFTNHESRDTNHGFSYAATIWQSVVKSRVAPGTALRLAGKARRGSILDIFDRAATRFSRHASSLECSGGFATGC